MVILAVLFLFRLNHNHRTTPSVPTVHATTHTPSSAIDSQLQSIIQQWGDGQSFSSAVVVHDINHQSSASLNPAKQVVTASVYKLFVAYAVLHQVEQGKLTLDTTLSSGQTVQSALTAMVTQSDNASAEALGFTVGWQTINSAAAAIGATHTNIDNYDTNGNYTSAQKVTTASDVDTLLSALQSGKLLNSAHTSLLLDLMKRQVWRERVPAGVPSGVAVADKPGWLSPADGYNGFIENDAAIVYGPKKTYILIIMTSSPTTQPLANLSAQIYTHMET